MARLQLKPRLQFYKGGITVYIQGKLVGISRAGVNYSWVPKVIHDGPSKVHQHKFYKAEFFNAACDVIIPGTGDKYKFK